MAILLAEESKELEPQKRRPVHVEARFADGYVARIDGYQVVLEGRFLKIITGIDECEYVAFDQSVHVKMNGVLQKPLAAAAPPSIQPATAPPAEPQMYVNPAMEAIRKGEATRVPLSRTIAGTPEIPARSEIVDADGRKMVVDAGFL